MAYRATRRWTLLSLLVSLAVGLAGLEVVLRVLTDRDEGRLLATRLVGCDLIDPSRIRPDSLRLRSIFDQELGWTAPPEVMAVGSGEGRAAEPSGPTSPRGGRRPLSHAPPGVYRVCAFGESFTYGEGVAAGECWPARVEWHAGGRAEVLNFGVGAYGLDQAYLSFRRHAPDLAPDLVLVGLTHHAVERAVNIYHPFYSHTSNMALAKPRFIIDGDSLRQLITVVPDPIEFLALIPAFDHHPWRAHEAFYDPALFRSSWVDRSRCLWLLRSELAWRRRRNYLRPERIMDREGEPVRLSCRLIERMNTEAKSLGARLVVVILPTWRMLRVLGEGTDAWMPVRDELARSGVAVWDLQPDFARDANLGIDYLPDGHLSASGNERVAVEIWRRIAGGLPARRTESPPPEGQSALPPAQTKSSLSSSKRARR